MLTEFYLFTDYDKKALVTVGGGCDQSLHLRCFGGKLPKLLPSKKPPAWETNFVHVYTYKSD